MNKKVGPRVLIVTRLFSGLINSVVTRQWNPTGIPAIYKLIEGMNRRGFVTDVLFLCKNKVESKDIKCSETFRLRQDSIKNVQFHVVPFRSSKLKSQKLDKIINAFFQFLYFLKFLVINRPNIIYCDRSHVIFGAITLILFHKRVFLRLLGFYPDMKAFITKPKHKFFHPITFLAYRVPFTGVICTQDDSGGGYYMPKIANSKTPQKLLLNEVDYKRSTQEELDELMKRHDLSHDRPILLFVGKLEKEKGCIEFVETMLNLSILGYKFYALVIGSGPLTGKVEKLIHENDHQGILRFVGPIENKKIQRYYNLTDIYVHLYIWASLTNTVLEAMCAGNALVLVSPSKEEHIGEYAEELIPQECVVKFNRENIVEDLSIEIGRLLENPEKIVAMKKNMAILSNRVLYTWNQRINNEIDLILQSVSNDGEKVVA